MANKSINRSDIILRLSERLRIDPALAEEVVKSVLGEMRNAMAEKKRIEIRGFGSFELRYRPARVARNPKTGESIETSARHAVHFKPGKEIRERINEVKESK